MRRRVARTTVASRAAPSTAREGRRATRCRPRRRRRPRARTRRPRRAERTPPTPTIGVVGSAAWHAATQYSSDGCSGGPDSPPVPAPSALRRCSTSTTSARSVFTSTSAVAPASTAARATSTSRSVVGLSLAQHGRPLRIAAPTAAAVADGECANIAEPSCRLGQLTFTSTAATVRAAQRLGRARRTRRWSSPRSTRRRSRRARQPRQPVGAPGARRPGPWRPTAFTIPSPAGATRGAGLPVHGSKAQGLHHDRPELGEVPVGGELVVVARGARRGEDRAAQRHGPDGGREVHVGGPHPCSSWSVRTIGAWLRRSATPCAAARAAASVVRHGHLHRDARRRG